MAARLSPETQHAFQTIMVAMSIVATRTPAVQRSWQRTGTKYPGTCTCIGPLHVIRRHFVMINDRMTIA